MLRGVFWIVENKLMAYPFNENYKEGISKSSKTYNHKKLWKYVRPKGCNNAFDYYPRGRVEYTGKGKAVIYMSPHVDCSFISEIIEAFELECNPIIKYDHSSHYHCYLDEQKG